MKYHHFLNGMYCDKLSNLIAAFWVDTDQFERDFNAMIAYITQNIDKKGSTNNCFICQAKAKKEAVDGLIVSEA